MSKNAAIATKVMRAWSILLFASGRNAQAQGAKMLQGTTLSLKQKALEEAKRMLVITAYLSVLFSVFELHHLGVLRAQHLPYSYRVGFSLINALILASKCG